MQLIVSVTVLFLCCCWFLHVSYCLCILRNLDVVFSLYSLLFISFLGAITSCQNTSPSSAHYCHTHAYLGSTSWVMSVRMCSVSSHHLLSVQIALNSCHQPLCNVREASFLCDVKTLIVCSLFKPNTSDHHCLIYYVYSWGYLSWFSTEQNKVL